MLNDNNGLKSRGNDGPEGSLYIANMRGDWVANGTYIMNGEGVETYSPTHTYFGFRYVSITATQPIIIHSVRGLVATSVMEDTGNLST